MLDQTPSSSTASVRDDRDAGVAVLALHAAEHDVLVVVGEADFGTGQSLYDQLLQALPAPPRPVVVELSALTFCDLHGLDALREVARAAGRAGVALTFRGQSEQLRWLQHAVPEARSGCRLQMPAATVTDGSGATGAAC